MFYLTDTISTRFSVELLFKIWNSIQFLQKISCICFFVKTTYMMYHFLFWIWNAHLTPINGHFKFVFFVFATCIAWPSGCAGWARGWRSARPRARRRAGRSSGDARPGATRARPARRSQTWPKLTACRAGDFHSAHARGQLKFGGGSRYRRRHRRWRRTSSRGKIRSRGVDPIHSCRTDHNHHAVFFLLHSIYIRILLNLLVYEPW